jgi:hypothetical protein
MRTKTLSPSEQASVSSFLQAFVALAGGEKFAGNPAHNIIKLRKLAFGIGAASREVELVLRCFSGK